MKVKTNIIASKAVLQHLVWQHNLWYLW